MRTLVVGGGSIGARHLRNLRAAEVGPLALVEPDATRRAALCSGDVKGFAHFEQGLAWQPELVFITTPSSFHHAQALTAAQCGCHLFVEKPLAHQAPGIAELVALVAERQLISMVGCNMRFHPGPAMVKQLLGEGRIGRVLFAHIYTGSYLPDWRPWQDYRQSYSARADLGGGCLLDCVHEIDLARWYLGDVAEVFCLAEHTSALELNVEDVALLTCRHTNGALAQIQLDYVQRSYKRGCRIVGEHGSIDWDYTSGQVRCLMAGGGQWEWQQPAEWDTNQMYVDELHHLLDCLRRQVPTTLPIAEAAEVMRIVFAAKTSAATKHMIATKDVALC